MRILPSAREHGITDADIRAALRVPLRLVSLDEGLTLVIAADSTAQLLEIIVADLGDGDTRVIHAMILRSKFFTYL